MYQKVLKFQRITTLMKCKDVIHYAIEVVILQWSFLSIETEPMKCSPTHLHIEHQLFHNCNSTADNEVSFVDSSLEIAQNHNSRNVHIQMRDYFVLENSYM